MIRLSALIAGALGASAPAIADEVWSTPIGEVVYEEELVTGEAVLSFPGEAGSRLIAIIPGLAGVSTGRGFFSGVWIDLEAGEAGLCPAALINPADGRSSHAWGRLDLVFTQPDFPGGWVAMKGNCFDAPTDYLVGEPVAGE